MLGIWRTEVTEQSLGEFEVVFLMDGGTWVQ